ncbi:MAG: TonB-dependent siderophore receptor [Shinella sp.]|nr:MAG: TonB-dependent siderophore receptor [Shinella sp.]
MNKRTDRSAPCTAARLRHGTTYRRLLGGVACGILFAITGNASAEDSGTTTLSTIVVEGQGDKGVGPDRTIVARTSATGTKTDTSIVDVPAAVSVVTQKELEDRGVKNLQEAMAYTSGVMVDEFGSDNRYDYFRIRGFDQTALGTYRDGLPARIPAWFTASRVEPYGLQRVEVLKGSTSTLFGLNGPGGLVNNITKRPQDQFFAEIYTTLGDGHKEVGADVTGPLDNEGVWSYRLTGLWQEADYGLDYSRDDRLYIAPAFTISPDDGTSLTILTDYSRRETNTARGLPYGFALDPDTFLGEPDFNYFNTRQTDLGYLFEHAFEGGLTFRSSARYSHVTLDYADVYIASTSPIANRSAFTVDGVADRFTVDNQLQYDANWNGIESKTLVGVDYTRDRVHEDIKYGTAGAIDIFNPAYCGSSCITLGPYVNWKVNNQAVGLYAQEQVTFDERWILTFGGRYDYIDAKADFPDWGTSDASTDGTFTKRLGLTYKVNEGLAVYANYSESFQPLVAPTANGYTVSGTLKPQEGQQYEVGVKYRPDSFDGLFTLALFDLTQSNVPTNITPLIQSQIGKVNVKGIELEGKVALNDRWNAVLAYSYWDAEIKEDGIAGNAGNRPDRVPRHIASAWLDYTLPGNGTIGDLTLGGGVRYVGQSFGDTANTTSVGSYAVFDAAARYKVSDHVTLAVNAKNLFDRDYQTTCYYGTCYYGDRRSVLATLKYTW